MAIYLVGDIQGCLQELKALLAQAAFNPEQDQYTWPAMSLTAVPSPLRH